MVNLVNRLHHKVTLQTRQLLKDEYGGVTEKWDEGPVIFAAVEYLRGNEHFAQNSIPEKEAKTEARIRIRARRGLDPANLRVKFGPTTFDVLSIIPDGKNHEIQLMVRARELDQGIDEAVNP